ncbi:MAG: translation initiation factor IF-2 [Actinomycetes bacterium]
MAKKRVHEIAKERNLTSKEVIAKLQAAGVEVKVAASSVDEAVAAKVLDASAKAPAATEAKPEPAPVKPEASQAGAKPAAAKPPAPKAEAKPAAAKPASPKDATTSSEAKPAADAPAAPEASANRQQRPSREADAGAGKRRVVIDAQAARRPATGPPPPAAGPRRTRRKGGRRRSYEEVFAEAPEKADSGPARVRINSGATVKDVAEYLDVPVPEVIKKLMSLGEMATLTQTLPDDVIEVVAAELDKDIEIVHADEEAIELPEFEDEEADLVERPPVVTVMGHVDHGKTSLLDAIRKTEVAAGEAGGITQHIGAYQVHVNNHSVTFLDTPGHQAFTAMRARGAQVTDIAIVVVAADDGVKPQTEEAVDHARAAGVPIIVAVNKIDKEGAQPERVRGEMAQLGLQPVDWGGDTEFVDVSAKSGDGLDSLLETITVLAEIEELRANAGAEASGTVIESRLDPGRGAVVTVLVQRGTLRVGEAVAAGAHFGRVRAMHDHIGVKVDEAAPGEPVEVLGFDSVPDAGEFVKVFETDRAARDSAKERATRLKTEALARRSSRRISLEDIFSSGIQELTIVLKGDVAGSIEAIEDEIAKLPQSEVQVNVIHRGVGGVNESDVMLAAASGSVILGFNVRPVGDARALAEREGVEIRSYSIIYRALEDLRAAMTGMLEPDQVEKAVGTAEVRRTFKASKIGTIAGCQVVSGKVERGSAARLVRDGTVVYDGTIDTLRREKDDVREVLDGFECGIVLRDFGDVKEGDVIEVYSTQTVERELS